MKLRDILLPALVVDGSDRYAGVFNFHGMVIGVEHMPGDRNEWSGRATIAGYGEILGTKNFDGDAIDVLLGSDLMSQTVYVLQQRVPHGQNVLDFTSEEGDGGPPQYDEDKVVFGVATEMEARALFEDYYAGSGREVGGVIVFSVEEFREALEDPGSWGLPLSKATIAESVWTKAQATGSTWAESAASLVLGVEVIQKATIEEVMTAAEASGISWDGSEGFMDACEVLTGKTHLDQMDASELGVMAAGVSGQPDLFKAARAPSGRGWEAIPKGHRGGKRRRKTGSKGFEYWYPGQPSPKDHGAWEDDAAPPGVRGLAPGALVRVEGQDGLFRFTPEHKATVNGKTWVTDVKTGDHLEVKTSSVNRQRGYDPAAREKRRASARAAWEKRGKPQVGAVPPKGDNDLHRKQVTPETARTPVFAGSTAKKGTVEWKLENGGYPLRRYRAQGDKSWKLGTYIPVEDQKAFLGEMAGIVHSAALRIAKNFSITRKWNSAPTPEYEEIVSAAQYGLLKAVENYRGQGPFGAYAWSYARAFASQAARSELGRGVPLPSFMHHALRGFMAARVQAMMRNETDSPTPTQIAEGWQVQKKRIWRTDMGRYVKDVKDRETKEMKQVLANQGNELVPMVPWKIKGPDGKELGREYPSRIDLAASLSSFVNGERMADIEWMAQANADSELPFAEHAGRSIGESMHLKEEVNYVLNIMSEKNRRVLTLAWGLDGGKPLSRSELADALGMKPKKPKAGDNLDRQLRYLGKPVMDAAMAEFKEVAAQEKSDAWNVVRKWPTPEPVARQPIETGPSYNEIAAKFGDNDMLTRMYFAARHEGREKDITPILDRMARGEAPEEEKQRVTAAYLAYRDAQRIDQFKRYTKMHPVDADEAREMGTGTPPDAIGNHVDEVIQDYGIAISKPGHGKTPSKTSPAVTTSGSGGWSGERFDRFFGRRLGRESDRPPDLEGDNGK